MSKFQDLSGNKYGRLTVLHRVENNRHGNVQFLCLCDCGKEIIILASHLRDGNTTSCGCYKREYVANKNYKHGYANTRLYGVWGTLVQRCCNPKNADYYLYGGRGITLCEEWKDFVNFHNWAFSNGYDENADFGEKTIDRIDVNKGYSPDNCRFANNDEQANNKRNSRLVLFGNKHLTVSQLAKRLNVPYRKIYYIAKRNNWIINEVSA